MSDEITTPLEKKAWDKGTQTRVIKLTGKAAAACPLLTAQQPPYILSPGTATYYDRHLLTTTPTATLTATH